MASDLSHIFTLQQMYGYSDGSLLFSFQLQGNNSFIVNNTDVSLPPSFGQYHILLETDTSFTSFRTKILNPNLHQVYGGGTTTLTSGLGSNDSLYTVLTVQSGSPYSIDGHNLPFNQNMLVVFDSTLTVGRAESLGSSFVATYATSPVKRRVYFRSIESIGNQLFLTGQYVGINESPMHVVLPKDTLVPIIGNTLGMVDLNGPSKSFVARMSLNLTNSKINWLGNHKEYEHANLYPFLLHRANTNRVVFLMNRDNIWNPWVADTSLAIVSGMMRRNADRPETPQMVSFYPDGSKVVLSYASGKTALDTSVLASNSLRRDLFLACFNPNGSLRWHNRIQSTLLQPTVRKMVVKNNKAWFLSMYVGTQNDSNFVNINNQTYSVNVNFSLLCSIDASGNMTSVNLPNTAYNKGIIQDFSFFSNGDLALLVNTNIPVFIPGFPPAAGFYILRVDPNTGTLIDTRKVVASVAVPGVNSIEVDANDIMYISSNVNPNNPEASSKLYLYNSSSVIDSVTMINNMNSSTHTSLLKISWNKINWIKRFYGDAGATSPGYNNLFLINNRPLMYVKSQVNNQPMLWETQPIHNGTYAGYPTLVTVDSGGNLVRSRYIALTATNFLRKGSNEQLYISGLLNKTVQIDTIQIGNAGGNDGVSLVLDSNLVAKRSFRIASSFSESIYDVDIFHDSVAAFTFSAQVTPSLYTNRTTVQNTDYDPNAFLTTINLSPHIILPVRWISFHAEKLDQMAVFLRWQVADQVNSDSYEIEYSVGSNAFTKIGAVSALVNKTEYEFYHSTPSADKINNYRIRQIDKDGRFSYSPIRLIKFSAKNLFSITPNPATDIVKIYSDQTTFTIHIYENTGRKLISKIISSGISEIDISRLPKGTYVLVAENNGVQFGTRKFVKQ